MTGPEIPEKIGPYKVVRKLGEGGMGAVYEALHEAIGRRVAIKVLLSSFAKDAQFTSRFFNEARAVNVVEHPGLVQISDFGQLPDGAAYLVMELLNGESLARRISAARGPLPVGDVVSLTWQLADSLAAAHAKGIVHRDLKPDNVMLVRDPHMPGGERTKLLDFGIAKVNEQVGGAHVKTKTNALMGTPLYMSPEQCAGAGGVTDKSDVYSLGVMMFEMLAGQPPFSAEGAGQLIGMHMFSEPPRLSSVNRSVPKEIAALVDRLLRKAPDERPTMRLLAKELREQCDVYPISRSSRMDSLPADTLSNVARGTASTLGRSAAQIQTTIPAQRRTGILITAGLSIFGLLGAVAITRLSHSGEPSAAQNSSSAASSVASDSTSIEIDVVTKPPGASIIRASDGKTLGTGPARLTLPKSQQPLALRIRLAGYRDKELLVEAVQGGVYQTELDPSPELAEENGRQNQAEKPKLSASSRKNEKAQQASTSKKAAGANVEKLDKSPPKTKAETAKPNAILPIED